MRHPGFSTLVEAISPGSTLRSVRRLKGGLGARVDVLTLDEPSGGRRRVTLRRAMPEYRNATIERFTTNYRCLQLLEAADVPAPRPVLLDAEGRYFGVPCLVQSYIPGSSRYQPSAPQRDRWARELARGIAAVHRVTPESHDLSPFPAQTGETLLANAASWLEDPDAVTSPLVETVLATLRRHVSEISPLPPTLVHDDFWPGNTVWYRNRLVAVIDWEDAGVGDRRTDIAQAQLEVCFTIDRDLAESFVSAYEGIAGPLPDFWYYQLYRGLGALLWVEKWLEGYADAGLKLEPATVRREVEAFVQRALGAAEQFASGRLVGS